MRPSSVTLGLGLIALLGACASVEPNAPTRASTAAALPTPGYDWFFHDGDGDLSLAYGVAETDDVPVSMDCRAGAGRVHLTVSAGPDAKPVILLESGGETERFPATSEPSHLHEGVFLTAETRADAPVLQRFRRVGWLAIWEGDARRVYAPQPASEPGVERFFHACG